MIDARRLHNWLGIKVAFHHWMRRRLEEYGFEDGEDFRAELHKTAGRPRTDYLLTLDTAKELAMVERTDIGRQTRRYFIEMEKAQPLRTIDLNGAPWFVAVDVLKYLGLQTGSGMHYCKLLADEQTNVNRISLGMKPGKPAKLVFESGLSLLHPVRNRVCRAPRTVCYLHSRKRIDEPSRVIQRHEIDPHRGARNRLSTVDRKATPADLLPQPFVHPVGHVAKTALRHGELNANGEG